MSDKFKTISIWASTPATTRGEHAFISGDPKGKNFLYVNGNSIYIRDIENPSICDVYVEHQYPTSCARYSPSGFYIASGDNRGNLRIWDTVNPEHILYKGYTPIGGCITDLAWTEDSKRLLLVGNGREKFGAAIAVDTGTSCGKIDNINKKANCCDVRQSRPYRAITGADDFRVCFFENVPMKYKFTIDRHSRFVLCCKFAPDGSFFLTGGADGQCFLYDGKTGEFKQSLGGEKAHAGSIYGASWSRDSKQILTVSGDRTAKIWDVETGHAVTEFVFGDKVEHQQVGCLWQNNHLLTVGLNGYITYLNPSDPSTPIRVVKGHQKAIKSIAVSEDKTKVFSGSFDGNTNCWDVATGAAESVEGNKPSLLMQMDRYENKISTIAQDDVLRTLDMETMQYEEETCSLDSQPQGVARGSGNLSVVAGIEKITVVRNSNKASVLDIPFKATTVDIHPNMSEVTVGSEDGKLHVYTLSGDALTEKHSFQALSGEIAKCRYSPDGEYLVAGSAAKTVEIFRVQDNYQSLEHSKYKHGYRVTDVAWCANSRYYASASQDGSIFIWDVEKENPVIVAKSVHSRSEVSCVQWLSESSIVTGGSDGCLKVSTLQL